MPVVYADVVWLVNFVLDLVLLWTAGWLARSRIRWRWLAVAAAAGATYALLLFVPALSPLTTWAGKAAVSAALTVIAYPGQRWWQWAKLLVFYYLAAFVLAGAALALHFAVPGESLASGWVLAGHGVVFAAGAGGLALALAGPAGVGLLRTAVRRARRARALDEHLVTVRVRVGEREVCCTGLVDTGNQLRDPFTRLPVCLADAAVLAPLLPEPLQNAGFTESGWLAALQELDSPADVGRFCLIPFRGAGGRTRLTLGIRPDAVLLEVAGRVVPAQACVFAVHSEPLSVAGRFQAILHTDVLTGEDGLENDVDTSEARRNVAHSAAAVVDSHSRPAGRRG
ncbi:MAG: sigma-E processing peptidase SpoIIGA [Alicyclobacillus sp.]|nr:sigma-E processing peptidase SpoIIGA [Alicyclobacillus sp.]